MRKQEALSEQVRARLAALVSPAQPAGSDAEREPSGVDEWRSQLDEADAAAVPTAVSPSHRLPFAGRQLAVLVGLVILGLIVAAWAILSARAVPVAPAPVRPSQALPATMRTPAVSPTPVAEIVVHVLGGVRSPGVVRLRAGARVADAIAAAGGLTAGADVGELNLAEVAPDGAQIAIGTATATKGELRPPSNAAAQAAPAAVPGGAGAAPGGAAASGGGAAATVDLNTATLAQLDALPGVGPVTAQRILDFRGQKGKFSRIQELQEVDGIGPKLYEKLAAHVRV